MGSMSLFLAARPVGNLGAPAVIGLAALIICWYLAGNELMRRRARRLALWCRDASEPMGGTLAIRWLTNSAFQIEIQAPRSPFRSGSITGLVESLDVAIVWIWNRLRGRRDMVLLQLTLDKQPIWGLELFRTRSLLSGDARHRARAEQWTERALDEFRLASPGGAAPQELARRLLALLTPQRQDLVRLAVRRQGTHLTLAVNVPDLKRLSPAAFSQVAGEIARVTLSFAASA